MKKKRMSKINITCHYCLEFYKSKKREKEVINQKTCYKRYCKYISDYTHSKNKICENFVPASIFWCNKFGYWVEVEACLSRGICKKSCKQRKIIKELDKWKS